MRCARACLKWTLLGVLSASAMVPASAADNVVQTFNKTQLHDQFWSEGANFGDLNHDGQNDLVAGPYWWEGPEFKTRHEYYPATQTFDLKLGPQTSVKVPGFHGTLGRDNAYSDNFFAWVYDFNGDEWNDILVLGFPGQDASWFENPKGGNGHWARHKVYDTVDNESPTWVDLTGDGKPEIVCNSQGRFGYVTPDWKDPAAPWKFHTISPAGPWQRFTHGLGVGDVNGDKKPDLLEAGGWWEQPASLEGDPEWVQHKVKFADGGAQMYAYDVDGDGDNDVITSLQAHGFGLAWYEQTRKGDKIDFKQHLIMGQTPEQNRYGVKFSELHALDLIDIDGDGVKDIVTGKRFWSHGREGDPDRNSAAVLYWFRTVRSPEKGVADRVDFIPYLIDDDSGVGTQVVAGDINGDGAPDIVVGNKKGVFVHLQQRKSVSREDWEKAQPKPLADE